MKGEVRLVNGKRIATSEYRSWQMMKNRIGNPKANDFKYYGARGIRVCQRWKIFDNFLADMGRKPFSALTLERKNTNGNYYKRNCVWASRQTQARNRPNYIKLSLAMARKIRKLYATGQYRQIDLAAIFHTTQAQISQITRNASWRE